MSEIKTETKSLDYRKTADRILASLRRDRDRQILAKRFGLGLAKRQTLEKIGQTFGITRERVRQIEKSTLSKIKSSPSAELKASDAVMASLLSAEGGVITLDKLAAQLNAAEETQRPYIWFLANLAPSIETIDADDNLNQAASLKNQFDSKKIKTLLAELTRIIAEAGQPISENEIAAELEENLPESALSNLLAVSKKLACHDGRWGLTTWPSVNPKSIRDKTYLVLGKHGKPMHFSEIASHIKNSNFSRRDVTVQAVHNELIKDGRFVLIGRGIYALSEWGYTPGTVADIIVEILREEQPLHKDEIVKRVLDKRQVKTTTIILNLQEKEQFERVAKATYKLKG